MKDRRLATLHLQQRLFGQNASSKGNDITWEVFSKPWLTILSTHDRIERLCLLSEVRVIYMRRDFRWVSNVACSGGILNRTVLFIKVNTPFGPC